ncbi:hypothetical protein NDU88_004862 [Pleurodeles waltl]|uniref:Uncharacterized protein n=1 Tax=Pleurodeles waltl TaxID=8319 RepID=A0AAV7TSR3_PLEWA|nr:hypothetical protein NDU88_004862 [Pleurodeles waltl]
MPWLASTGAREAAPDSSEPAESPVHKGDPPAAPQHLQRLNEVPSQQSTSAQPVRHHTWEALAHCLLSTRAPPVGRPRILLPRSAQVACRTRATGDTCVPIGEEATTRSDRRSGLREESPTLPPSPGATAGSAGAPSGPPARGKRPGEAGPQAPQAAPKWKGPSPESRGNQRQSAPVAPTADVTSCT